MFGNAVQAENCADWGDWGPCIWLKGSNARWQRSYFDQLLPGRRGCRQHTFFKLLRERWGQAFSNVVDFLRRVTLSPKPCGFCSYQQSCGRQCTRSGHPNSMNALFVAERLCPEVDQSEACAFAYGSGPADEWQGCNHWPNAHIPLPNVSESMLHLVNNIQFLNCAADTISNASSTAAVCRCCCAPFAPNPAAGFRCELMANAFNESASLD